MIGTEFAIEAHFQIWLVFPRRKREDIKAAVSFSARAQGCMDRDSVKSRWRQSSRFVRFVQPRLISGALGSAVEEHPWLRHVVVAGPTYHVGDYR
jgi:hypothetical protein